MDNLILALGWAGLYGPAALAIIGSALSCAYAGQAAAGAMLESETGHGRFIGVAAMSSSQSIYGIVLMFALNRELTLENAPGIAAIGILAGLALMFSAFYQGRLLAAAINVFKIRPEVFGKSLAAAALVEGYSVFAFIFALVASASLV